MTTSKTDRCRHCGVRIIRMPHGETGERWMHQPEDRNGVYLHCQYLTAGPGDALPARPAGFQVIGSIDDVSAGNALSPPPCNHVFTAVEPMTVSNLRLKRCVYCGVWSR